jgi:hypothetical protein
MFENNLPGMLLFQAPIRFVLGWRSEVIRLADLLVIASCFWLLVRSLPVTTVGKWAAGFVLFAFYLSTNEWCHSQRDSWMLWPALLAFQLRMATCEPPSGNGSTSLVSTSIEGFLWGVAVWFKPHVLVPAFSCWLASVVLLRGKNVLRQSISLLLGGMLAGAAGLTWLWTSGAWADFWDILLVWNREYVGHDCTEGHRALVWLGLGIRFFPWMLAHLIAVPLALARLREITKPQADREMILLSALYFGWLVQVVTLQHAFDYPHVPLLLLALALLCREIAQRASARLLSQAFLVFCVLIRLTPLTVDRLPLVATCLQQGSTPELRDRLSLFPRIDWRSLSQVQSFLRESNVQDGQLSCLNMGPAALYLQLDQLPATRYVVLENDLALFPNQRPRIYEELAKSSQQFLVVDVERATWKDNTPPPSDDQVVFVAGRYRVYALKGDEMRAWVETHLALPAKASEGGFTSTTDEGSRSAQ